MKRSDGARGRNRTRKVVTGGRGRERESGSEGAREGKRRKTESARVERKR